MKRGRRLIIVQAKAPGGTRAELVVAGACTPEGLGGTVAVCLVSMPGA